MPSKASAIRERALTGLSPSIIASELHTSRAYVYQVLRQGQLRGTHKELLATLLREVRELRVELRILLRQSTHPLTRHAASGTPLSEKHPVPPGRHL